MKTKLRFPPICSKFPHMLHGGDYNPDQWIRTPGIWDEDIRLMNRSGCNAMSIGIFSWSALEPKEGVYEFGWLDNIMDQFAKAGIHAVLATPSGSKPAWLSRAYPEVRRIGADGMLQPHGGRHNHCPTSPVYREKCRIINTRLAERYRNHPSLLLWHVSNEYDMTNDCQCALCLGAFRTWLKNRYDHDLDRLNHAYWSSFWSHTFPDWESIEPNDHGIHGLRLDWVRWKSHQIIDFFKAESAPLRSITPGVPITTNFHGTQSINYREFAKEVDVVSWDFYPEWHEEGNDAAVAMRHAMLYDQCRGFKDGKPWMLMESVPSIPTRGKIKKTKEPGMHFLSSLQCIAHGSDTVQYFQWRKSRGCMEKFHGAVVDHEGSENSRVFREVSEVGKALEKLDAVVGTAVEARVALIKDWENEWAIREGARVHLGENTKYLLECAAHYRPFWESGIPVDVMDQTGIFENHALVVMPMAYMFRPGFAGRIKEYVENGGSVVMTYWSGVVDESDLCFLGGVPGEGLRKVFGVWEEESQSYYPHESVGISAVTGNPLDLTGAYKGVDTCSVIHAEGSTVLATYSDQYFSGSPALTVNPFGKGKAYYIAARTAGDFLKDFYGKLAKSLGINPVLEGFLPPGVTAQRRTDGKTEYVFLMNFNPNPVNLHLSKDYDDVLVGNPVGGEVPLKPYGVRVLRGR